MIFQYRGKNKNGEDIEGFIEASNKSDAVATLSEQGVAILFLEAQARKKIFEINLPFLNRVKTKDLVLFSRQLAVMTTATLPIVQSLRILIEQTDNQNFQSVISEIADDVEGGERLSNALDRHNKIFSPFFVAMVRSGETSGSIDRVLNYLADEQEKDYALVSKIKGAMIYPAFILAALGGVGVVMMVYVVPKITSILLETGGELPLATRVLIGTSNFLVTWWWALALFIISVVFALRYVLRQEGPRKFWDRLKLKLPIFGSLFQRIYIVRFARSMGTLVEGGVPITTSLNIVSDIVGNAYYKDIIDRTARDVQDGNPIASLFLKSKEIPPMIAHMLSVGEKTGRISDVLNKMTDFYAREIEGLVANLISLIEPMIMVVMGVGVGIMVAAVMMPMYNMSSGF
ncbi:MAG TPA: type II secretion system F family protein [bacterium]|nr:type II secretion system F family protein [bacterium]